MANPHLSNVYGGPVLEIDEPHSFESISYTDAPVPVNTVFRGPLQAPVFEWWRDDYSWVQDTPLSLLEAHVILRSPLQAPVFEWSSPDYSWTARPSLSLSQQGMAPALILTLQQEYQDRPSYVRAPTPGSQGKVPPTLWQPGQVDLTQQGVMWTPMFSKQGAVPPPLLVGQQAYTDILSSVRAPTPVVQGKVPPSIWIAGQVDLTQQGSVWQTPPPLQGPVLRITWVAQQSYVDGPSVVRAPTPSSQGKVPALLVIGQQDYRDLTGFLTAPLLGLQVNAPFYTPTWDWALDLWPEAYEWRQAWVANNLAPLYGFSTPPSPFVSHVQVANFDELNAWQQAWNPINLTPLQSLPSVTIVVDPFAKHANTQVIRESHARKYLGLKKRKEVQRVDLDTQQVIAAGIVPTSVKPVSAQGITGLKDQDSQLLSALSTSWRLEDVRSLRSAAIVLTHIIIDEDK